MSTKYLGETFDIHGGGMDLLFPHHECEIAQSVGADGKEAVKYWMHNNMITINGQKMGKSLGNFITLEELFTGSHKLLEQAYSPMTIRFFILQAQYRSTLDFSNEALKAAGKGLEKLLELPAVIEKIIPSEKSTADTGKMKDDFYSCLNDDLNTASLIAAMFEHSRIINRAAAGQETLTAADRDLVKKLYHEMIFEVLGLRDENQQAGSGKEILDHVVGLLLEERHSAKQRKDFETADRIRNKLNELGIEIKDNKDGAEWKIK
jgi:cysteinyl-tRNA synthetase